MSTSPYMATVEKLARLRRAIGQLQQEFEELGLTPPSIVCGHPGDLDKLRAMVATTDLMVRDATLRSDEVRFAGTRFLPPLRRV